MAALPIGDAWQKGNEDDVSEIPSCLCPNCGSQNATTLMLPTKVPAFREIIIMTINCEDCNFRNSEVNFGGEIQEKGERLSLQLADREDLNRQIIKSDSATVNIPSLELEIPPNTQRGSMSTLEGFLLRAAENLQELQPQRLQMGDVDNFHRCRKVISKLRTYAGHPDENDSSDDDDEEEDDDDNNNEKDSNSWLSFEIIVDDPAGNSYIENPKAPLPDPNLTSTKYYRTPKQDIAIGLQPAKASLETGLVEDSNPQHKSAANVAPGSHPIEIVEKDSAKGNKNDGDDDDKAPQHHLPNTSLGRQEVLKFPTTCPHCHQPAETDMCMTDIPHFKEIILMSLLCDSCGYKSNEIKGGGAIPRYGTKITLRVRSTEDLAREVLKSDTAGVEIPELDFSLDEGGLDGLYTSVEGLVTKLHDRLESANPFGSGDAATKQHLTNDGGTFSEPSPNHVRYQAFLAKLKDLAAGKMLPFTLIISDPLSNSFVGPVPSDAVALALQAEKDGNKKVFDEYVDPGMEVEEYERSDDQNEMLGLNDIKTENYQNGTKGSDGGDNESSRQYYYGTDTFADVPDRISRLDVRGPDHPHAVGKAPVQGDTTVMGVGSVNFAVPSMGARGKAATPKTATAAATDDEKGGATKEQEIVKMIAKWEHEDSEFMMNEEFDGAKDGMVFKDGAQGLGYYRDVPLEKRIGSMSS